MMRLFLLLLFLATLPLLSESEPNCDRKNVCSWVETGESESAVYLQAKSLPPETHITVFTSIEGTGVESIPPTPKSFVLNGNEKTKVLLLKKKEGADPSSVVQVLTVAYYGKLGAVHDDSYAYTLPFDGKSWISTGYNSGAEHRGDAANSLDFVLTEGTPILAAREGTVVEAEDKFTVGMKDPTLIDKANHIIIEHSDGTVAIYGHLKPEGVIVKTGDKVIAGQRIGYSGNTGYSTGPHLHFEVYRPEENRRKKTFPTLFVTETGEKEYLSEENAYWNPDGKRFQGFPITNLEETCLGTLPPEKDKEPICSENIIAKKPFYLTMPIYKAGPYLLRAEFILIKTQKVILNFQEKIPAGITSIAWRIPAQTKSGKYKVKFYLDEKELGEKNFQMLP
ncbi:M23 family metallopeptidase [Leptospira semungkisensis]|uniref:M23 family metallopeptidase n=1 Tax=Leptospira semungkisensis TaxID=2484985 RepID=A0A4R9G6A7_9LEPT|nr:M23 family metallopeptidase [Leptospira semungkisensis]TGK06941.1 M23 family metallopeptidase [Leptospira semungkisensis]